MFAIDFNSTKDLRRLGARTGKVVLRRESAIPKDLITGRNRIS
jgi:hypothetical protein